jgi:hypothetical protein
MPISSLLFFPSLFFIFPARKRKNKGGT